jgi:hypothetical protein
MYDDYFQLYKRNMKKKNMVTRPPPPSNHILIGVDKNDKKLIMIYKEYELVS